MPLRAAVKALPALLAVLAAAVLATGCGSGGAAAVLDPVAKAATTTSHAEGAKLAMHMQMNLGSLGGPITLDANGHANFEKGETEIDDAAERPAGRRLERAARGHARSPSGSPARRSTSARRPSPASSRTAPAGSSSTSAPPCASSAWTRSRLASGQSNPAQFLSYLQASGGDVHADGTESVRGVTHDPLQRLDRPAQGAREAALRRQRGEQGSGRQAGRRARHRARSRSRPGSTLSSSCGGSRSQLPLSVAGQHLEASITIEFFDFGPTPAVQAPAPAETYEVSTSALGGDASALGG